MNAEERKCVDDCGKVSFVVAYMSWGHTEEEANKAWNKLWDEHRSEYAEQGNEEAQK